VVLCVISLIFLCLQIIGAYFLGGASENRQVPSLTQEPIKITEVTLTQEWNSTFLMHLQVFENRTLLYGKSYFDVAGLRYKHNISLGNESEVLIFWQQRTWDPDQREFERYFNVHLEAFGVQIANYLPFSFAQSMTMNAQQLMDTSNKVKMVQVQPLPSWPKEIHQRLLEALSLEEVELFNTNLDPR
jgi:hypothetical protein